MLKVSTKGRYGLRMMFCLALNYSKDAPVLLKEIAKSEGISEGYLEQLVPLLKSSGFIKSVRGARGGYKLSKAPDDITVKDVVEAMEGPLRLVECLNEPYKCARKDYCPARDVWEFAGAQLSNALKSVTLGQMVNMYKSKTQNFLEYNI